MKDSSNCHDVVDTLTENLIKIGFDSAGDQDKGGDNHGCEKGKHEFVVTDTNRQNINLTEDLKADLKQPKKEIENVINKYVEVKLKLEKDEVEEEKEEECIKSVDIKAILDKKYGSGKEKNDEDNTVGYYTTKGPEFFKQSSLRKTPYDVPSHIRSDHSLNFRDNDEKLYSEHSNLLQDIEPRILGLSPFGIPSLPGPNEGLNKNLMNNIDNMFGVSGLDSRIIIHNYNDPLGFTTLSTRVSITIDLQVPNSQIGVWIPKQTLPSSLDYKSQSGNRMNIYIQLDPKCRRVVKYAAQISIGIDKYGSKFTNIDSQFMVMKPFMGKSGVELLMDGLNEKDIEEATTVVANKDIVDIFKTYGPNEATMLMVLCCQKGEEPSLRAQILALTKRILAQDNTLQRANIIQKDNINVSALEYAVHTNKPRISAYLAELYYDIGEDHTCTDAQGNNLLHLLARKGDEVAATMSSLLQLRFSCNNKQVYPSDVCNFKKQMPIHIAAQNLTCQKTILRILLDDYPSCISQKTNNGSLPLHLACQYSKDPVLIATMLYYNKNAINVRRNDGLSPLHLVAARNHINDLGAEIVSLEENIQIKMICILLEYGADVNMLVNNFTPFMFVSKDRPKVMLLLRVHGKDAPGYMYPSASPITSSLADYSNIVSGFNVYGQSTYSYASDSASHAFPDQAINMSVTASNNSIKHSASMGDFIYYEDNPTNTCQYKGVVTGSNISDTEKYHLGTNGDFASKLERVASNYAVNSEAKIDAIAEVLYNHPTIQTVIENEANC